MALRLKSFRAESSSSSADIGIDKFGQVTTFIGPNGSGKTTILEVLNIALWCLSKGTVRDSLQQVKRPWLPVKKATLVFEVDEPSSRIPLGALEKYFGNSATQIEVSLHWQTNTDFTIIELQCNNKILSFASVGGTRTDISNIEEAKKAAVDALKSTTNPGQGGSSQQRQPDIDRHAKALISLQAVSVQFEDRSTALPSTPQSVPLSREALDGILGKIGFPMPVLIDARVKPPNKVKDLIGLMLSDLHRGKHQRIRFDKTIQHLKDLLQAEVDCRKDSETGVLEINGVSHDKASLGTQITLQYFAMTYDLNEVPEGDSNTIVLWDEPENSLHPTRRHRIFSLLLNDKRQSVVATHATEFTSLYSDKNIIYRCDCQFDESSKSNRIETNPVVERRDAFLIAEQLGIHPSATLFTADVAIWVEGPCEVIFLKHWLASRLEPKQIFEGFHYTFVMYGGSLIAHLEACDEKDKKNLMNLISVCRNPIILVDSDLSADPGEKQPRDSLKPGAAALRDDIGKLNKHRPDSAIFECTNGREIENYLPPKAVHHAVIHLYDYGDKKDDIQPGGLEVGRWEHYYDVINKYLEGLGLVKPSSKPNEPPKVKGQSKWGEYNKVEFMRTALQCPDLEESDLLHNASKQIDEIAVFIESHCNRHH